MPEFTATMRAPHPAALVAGPRRFVESTAIATQRRKPVEAPSKYGEKPYEQLVAEAFDGPVLRLSRKLKLMEVADERHIRRGDALDLIASTRRKLEQKHAKRPWSPTEMFARQYIAFAAFYVTFAVAWCIVMTMQH